ncbi:hypothetical protein BU24DRAFT_163850 [Aaosphaeria arxii CBS 175.79]|uniref:Uncharacterized protein n=1 Tax=Aaosphaeria arxii CBS 175.79 TaxID=1450172 RepID=A0A6A5XZ01_9PLEO|nr:uncharacterized protein BU24DRAFT_163850 [Aaosphaeria arxii CBS 175.79]KAF2018047.1 hypothetical protein BU24DRAFT_163850 [Aaosphaeria arxii CBS 175.79]
MNHTHKYNKTDTLPVVCCRCRCRSIVVCLFCFILFCLSPFFPFFFFSLHAFYFTDTRNLKTHRWWKGRERSGGRGQLGKGRESSIIRLRQSHTQTHRAC